MVQNVLSYQAVQQAGRNPPNEPPTGSISKRLDDMLSTPFCPHIIHYDPPRGFLVPKSSTYDGSSDPFDHIMYYRQLMTQIGRAGVSFTDFGSLVLALYDVEDGISKGLWTYSFPSDVNGKKSFGG